VNELGPREVRSVSVNIEVRKLSGKVPYQSLRAAQTIHESNTCYRPSDDSPCVNSESTCYSIQTRGVNVCNTCCCLRETGCSRSKEVTTLANPCWRIPQTRYLTCLARTTAASTTTPNVVLSIAPERRLWPSAMAALPVRPPYTGAKADSTWFGAAAAA
jgi:hypothetical protein